MVDILNVNISVFWDITPCSPLKGNRSFGAYRLHFQGPRISRGRNQRESKWKAEQSAQVKVTLRLTVNQFVLVSNSIWGLWQDVSCCSTVTVLSMWGAVTNLRTGLSFVRVTVRSNKSFASMHLIFTIYMLLHGITMRVYIQYIQGSSQSRPTTADYAL
jgi:hypothetical protein